MGKTNKYSGYVRPFSFALDLLTINVLAYFVLPENFGFWYHLFITSSWTILIWTIDFYEIYRHTKVIRIIGKLIKQYITFLILNFAYIGFLGKFSNPFQVVLYVTFSLFVVGLFKFLIYFLLRKYRVTFGRNHRRVVILGNGNASVQLMDFFKNNPDYGYKLEGVFDLKTNKVKQLQECYDFVLESEIDEIYSSLSDINNEEVNNLIDFADNNLKTLKFIPDSNKQPLVRNLTYDYYDHIPILSLRNIPLHKRSNKIVKRAFDIVFSSAVLILVLSWLTPILALLIRLESKGNIFFRQKRNGLNNKTFNCYKFRSMRCNKVSDEMWVTKSDLRVTKIGAFIRKTSIDELPQFWNVFKGDMSVVGPRPHMISDTERFLRRTNKFMARHFIKPGITGLAQTSGCRGEVKTDKDIINRLRYDIFYMENWSFVLDVKIILQTIYNALKGDKKAY